MIDLHSHLLPGVDDGSRSVTQSLDTLRRFGELGIEAVVLTPHFRASQVPAGLPATFDVAFQMLREEAPVRPKLYRGVEMMVDVPLRALPDPGRYTLAGSRYLLIEFPRMVTAQAVGAAVTQLVDLDIVPVVAHPERYQSCTPATARDWRSRGAALQVDATTLTTDRARGRRARSLVQQGLADVLAADNHGDGRVLATGRDFLRRMGAGALAEVVTRTNPRAIVENRDLHPVGPIALRRSWTQLLTNLLHRDE